MIATDKQTEAGARKQKIREKYRGVDPSLLEVIPAIESTELREPDRILKVAAYVRVSTENDQQTSSFELQVNEFTDKIKANPKWEFAGIYSDEGISGTNLAHRTGMLQMIEDAKAGKVDLILTKSIARFARNIVDCLSIVETLKNLNPPVGVQFDTDNIYTLDNNGRMILTILASVAEEESHSKSSIMEWSIDKRFSKGIFLTPELLGYDLDEDGNLIINPDEAETVKVIFNLFVNGYGQTALAELLTQYGRQTKLGNEVWNRSSIDGVLGNERYCGDIRARKTFTPNFLNHKSVKNRGQRRQYIQRDHHDAIVSREIYNAANLMRSSYMYTSKNRPLPVLSVIEGGILHGYVPIDKNWTGFSAEDYQTACESVDSEMRAAAIDGKRINMGGYQMVRPDYFPSFERPSMTITNGKLRFNTACLKKFADVEYVELLLNTVKNCIAIRPCEKDNPNAIHWGRLREERWAVSTIGCRGLAKTLFDMMNWEDGGSYRFSGEFKIQGDNKLLLFELGEPVVTKVKEQIIPSKNQGNELAEEIVVREKIRVYPDSWGESFGVPVNLLIQQHYDGDWDVLRPATELKEMNIITAEKLAALRKEAENIIEGWMRADE